MIQILLDKLLSDDVSVTLRKNIESLEKALEVLNSFLGKNLMADRNEEFEVVEDICDTLMESSEKCMYLGIREVKSLYNLQI